MGGSDENCPAVTSAQQDAITIANLTSSALSVLGSALTIIFLLFLKDKKSRQPLQRLILWLSIADLAAAGGVVLSTTVHWINPNINFGVCEGFRVWIEIFFLSATFWTCCITFFMWRSAYNMRFNNIVYLIFHAISWGIPIILVVVAIVTHSIYQPDYDSNGHVQKGVCTLTEKMEWIVWFAPLLAGFVWNIIFYILILFKFYSTPTTKNYVKRSRAKMSGKLHLRITLYILAFLLCWVFDVASHIRSLFVPDDCANIYLWFLTDTFSPLQGFLNFLVYTLTTVVSCGDRKKDRATVYSVNGVSSYQPIVDPI